MHSLPTANCTLDCSLNTCRAILSSRGSAHVYLPARDKRAFLSQPRKRRKSKILSSNIFYIFYRISRILSSDIRRLTFTSNLITKYNLRKIIAILLLIFFNITQLSYFLPSNRAILFIIYTIFIIYFIFQHLNFSKQTKLSPNISPTFDHIFLYKEINFKQDTINQWNGGSIDDPLAFIDRNRSRFPRFISCLRRDTSIAESNYRDQAHGTTDLPTPK